MVSPPTEVRNRNSDENRERGTGNTFHRDGSGAARHAKLVSRHAGVETGVRLGCIPYPKVAVVQNGDPVNEMNTFMELSQDSLSFLLPSE